MPGRCFRPRGPRVDLPARFVSVSEMASQRFARLLKILVGAVVDADEVLQLEGRLERFVHFWALAVRQFIRHRCFVRASALSYSTLLALIPLLVVALSVTSSFLKDRNEAVLAAFVEKTVSSIAPPAEIPTNAPGPANAPNSFGLTNVAIPNPPAEISPETNAAAATATTNAPPAAGVVTIDTQKETARWIHDLVAKTSSGTLGAFGLIGLVLTAISLLRGIEETFNDMWGVTRSRSWGLQILLYWGIITLGPLLLSTALAATGSTHMQATRSYLESSPFLAPVLRHLLPVALLTVTLGLFYKLTPNTKVEWSAAMIGGLCAGALWHFYNQLSFLLVARALSASKFYGSIFLFVLLMGGLYILWLIILFGAQTAYAYQNRVAYLQERLAENINQRGREFVALRIMTCLARRFQAGLDPATVPQISSELGLPSRLTQSVLRTLAATRLVCEVAGAEAAFAPARPLESISVHDILLALRTGTGQELLLVETPELAEIYGEFARIEQAERNAAARVSLRALALRTPSPVPLPPLKAVPPELKVEPAAVKSTLDAVPTQASGPERTEAPSPSIVEPIEPPRREPARPDDHPDFPL